MGNTGRPNSLGSATEDLATEQPTAFELVINIKTAKALVLTVPPSMVARAEEVVENPLCANNVGGLVTGQEERSSGSIVCRHR